MDKKKNRKRRGGGGEGGEGGGEEEEEGSERREQRQVTWPKKSFINAYNLHHRPSVALKRRDYCPSPCSPSTTTTTTTTTTNQRTLRNYRHSNEAAFVVVDARNMTGRMGKTSMTYNNSFFYFFVLLVTNEILVWCIHTMGYIFSLCSIF